MPVETLDATGLSYRSKLALGAMMACAPCCSGSGGGSGGGTGNIFCGGCDDSYFAGEGPSLFATFDIDCMGIAGLTIELTQDGSGWLGEYTQGDPDFSGTTNCVNGTGISGITNELHIVMNINCCDLYDCTGCQWQCGVTITGRVGATEYYATHAFNLTNSAGCSPLIFDEVTTTVICTDEDIIFRHCDGSEDTTTFEVPEEVCCQFGGDFRTTHNSTVGCGITINISE